MKLVARLGAFWTPIDQRVAGGAWGGRGIEIRFGVHHLLGADDAEARGTSSAPFGPRGRRTQRLMPSFSQLATGCCCLRIPAAGGLRTQKNEQKFVPVASELTEIWRYSGRMHNAWDSTLVRRQSSAASAIAGCVHRIRLML